jgi:hypothetical protein
VTKAAAFNSRIWRDQADLSLGAQPQRSATVTSTTTTNRLLGNLVTRTADSRRAELADMGAIGDACS